MCMVAPCKMSRPGCTTCANNIQTEQMTHADPGFSQVFHSLSCYEASTRWVGFDKDVGMSEAEVIRCNYQIPPIYIYIIPECSIWNAWEAILPYLVKLEVTPKNTTLINTQCLWRSHREHFGSLGWYVWCVFQDRAHGIVHLCWSCRTELSFDTLQAWQEELLVVGWTLVKAPNIIPLSFHGTCLPIDPQIEMWNPKKTHSREFHFKFQFFPRFWETLQCKYNSLGGVRWCPSSGKCTGASLFFRNTGVATIIERNWEYQSTDSSVK